MCIFIKNCTFPPLVGAQRAHSAFRGHTVPLSPTAFPKKANGKEFAFCSIGEALQKQGKNLHKGNHRSPTTCKK